MKYLAREVVFIQSVHQRAMNSLATAVGSLVEAAVDFWYKSTLVSVCHATINYG